MRLRVEIRGFSMNIEEVRDFAEYEVYEIVDNKKHTICVCKESEMAEVICYQLALNDSNRDKYYYTSIYEKDTLTIGGGWYKCYQRINDKIEVSTLE